MKDKYYTNRKIHRDFINKKKIPLEKSLLNELRILKDALEELKRDCEIKEEIKSGPGLFEFLEISFAAPYSPSPR